MIQMQKGKVVIAEAGYLRMKEHMGNYVNDEMEQNNS